MYQNQTNTYLQTILVLLLLDIVCMCVCEHNPQSHAIKHVKSYFAFYTPGLYIKKEIELLYPPQNHVPNYIVEKLNKQAIHLNDENKWTDKHWNKPTDH